MALAAWQPPGDRASAAAADWRILALPFAACTASIALLLRRRPAERRSRSPSCFAAAALLTAMVRTHDQRLRAAPARRDPPPGEHRRADRPAQPPLVRPRAARARSTQARATGRLARAARDRPRPLQGAQRHARPPRRRPRARPARPADPHRAARRRPRRPPRRRRVRRAAARRGRRRAAPASGSPRRCRSASPSRASSCRSPPASASRCSPSTATTPRRCSSAPTSRCTRPRRRRSGTEFYARERDLHTRERLQLIGELRDAVAERPPDAALPAQARPRPQPDHRRRGARALAAPDPRHGPARRVHPARRADRRDRPADRAGDPQGAAPGRRLARARDRRSRWPSTSPPPTCSRTAGPTACWPRSATHGVRPDRFVIEITEDVLMTDPDRSLTALAALSARRRARRARRLRDGLLVAVLPQAAAASTSSRSTARSCSRWAPTRPTRRSCRPRSTSAAGSASASPPRASRTRPRCGG